MKTKVMWLVAVSLFIGGACSAQGVQPQDQVVIRIEMPSDHFGPGDLFYTNVHTQSISGEPVDCRLFFLLEINDTFFMYPGWAQSIPPEYNLDWENITVRDEVRVILPKRCLPEDMKFSIDGFRFAAVCTEPDGYEIISNLDNVYWSYGP
ncbi:hypothetical protein JXA40_07905 [bacterium]|nr:hypothetical protein [candidate division CSSED10-310 bacterium]